MSMSMMPSFLAVFGLLQILILFAHVAANDPQVITLVDGQNRTNIVAKEYEQWKAALDEMKSRGIKLRGFYHTSSWAPYWQDVLLEQLMIMDGKRIPKKWSYNPPNISDMSIHHLQQSKVSVLEHVDKLYLNVAGEDSKDLKTIKDYVTSLKLKYHDHIQFNFNKTAPRGAYRSAVNEKKYDITKKMSENMELSEGESSTIMTLQSYCKNENANGRNSYIFYIHSKGGCCVRGKKQVSYNVNPVASWREGMNTFNLEFPSICLRALNSGYSACGMEYQDAHHSGNFWWANCEHISALPPLQDRFDAWGSEFFLYRISPHFHLNKLFGENCGYSSYKCIGVNHYDHECPRSVYRNKLLKYASNYELPVNDVATISKKPEWVQKNCGDMRKRPYYEQPFWSDMDKFPMKQKVAQE